MELRTEIIDKILSCPTCKIYLALTMTSPLRCPGLSYNDTGEQIVNSGRLWSEIVKEHEEESRKKLESYYAKHKKHIDNHFVKM